MPHGETLPRWKRERIVELVREDVEVEFIIERLDVCKQTVYNIAEQAGMPLLQWMNRGYEAAPIVKVKRTKTGGRPSQNSRCAS